MTFKSKLPDPADNLGVPMADATEPDSRPRASGRVELAAGARLTLISVSLNSIRGMHPALQDRDARLDLAGGQLFDLTRWTKDSLDLILCTAPPWVIERGAAAGRHYLIVAGGQLVQTLRRVLPSSTQIPVVVVDAKFTNHRWLQVAAMHATAIAGLAAGHPPAYLRTLMEDAKTAGAELTSDGHIGDMAAALGTLPTQRNS